MPLVAAPRVDEGGAHALRRGARISRGRAGVGLRRIRVSDRQGQRECECRETCHEASWLESYNRENLPNTARMQSACDFDSFKGHRKRQSEVRVAVPPRR